ncbi:hypothetical protein BYT27DRAFT_7193283 [Phlegmacium glaucopus]|nr:hypothetical protein BYT27DRAFT_7193283 [Phlegmacium glaucopus]
MAVSDFAEAPQEWVQPLNDNLYYLDADEKDFFQKETKINDDEELKQHIIGVQRKAYSGVFQYPYIRVFQFARMTLARLPAYQALLELGRKRKGAIFIDLGCCFGNDLRKAVQDGYPVENVLASDLRGDLWHLGHELFKSTPESFPVPFVQGDILDLNFLEPDGPFSLESPATTPIPSLKTLASLNPLRGHVSAVYTAAFFHLFSEEDQLRIAKMLAGLLSPEPGSMLLGVHAANDVKGFLGPDSIVTKRFCHSPESWKGMWEDIFGKGKVEVKTRLRMEIGGPEFFGTFPGNTLPFQVLEWSVTRL